MSNEPIFQKLAREYAMRGKSYERMTAPHMAPVRPLGTTKQSLMDTPVYAPDPHLDGPYKEPLPKRNLAQLIQIPEPDPEVTKKFQEFITTAPMQILQGTPAGSFIQTFKGIRVEEDNTMTLRSPKPKADLLEKGLAERQLAIYRGMVDPAIQYEIDQEAVVLTKTITTEELLEGKTSVDAIQELGQEFAEKYPEAKVLEVNVGEKLNGDVVVTVRGTLISEEDGTSTSNPEQTDESVNAASNEETDEDDERVILAPNFWKIRDEE